MFDFERLTSLFPKLLDMSQYSSREPLHKNAHVSTNRAIVKGDKCNYDSWLNKRYLEQVGDSRPISGYL